jgi:4-hydroxymandelate oxidase
VTAFGDLEARARQVLPQDVFTYFAEGAGAELTVTDEVSAWSRIPLRPRILRDVRHATTSTSILGSEVTSPIAVAPMALLASLHPQGEAAVARASRDSGTLFIHSMRSGSRLPDVAEQAGPYWQQVYVLQDRGVSDEVARAAAAHGARALVLTVDTPRVARKRVSLPHERPETAILPALDNRDPDDVRLQQAADVTERDIARLGHVSGLPVVVKGVLRADEAIRCIDAGAAAIVVSTHGGRQLDGVVPSSRALPDVVAAVGGRAEVYVDGGIRQASDVLRALALGAKSAWIGRPVAWALACGGGIGVMEYLCGMSDDVLEALTLAGCTSCEDVGDDLLLHV